MPIYTITLWNRDGGVHERRSVHAEDDNDAIDLARESKHQGAIDIDAGERHVARLPPWSWRFN
jgi:hypothetical protein